MSFHLGKPILALMLVASGTGAVVLTRAPQKRADLTVWVFHDSQARAYRSISGEFSRRTGLSVDVLLIANRALNVRLESIFMSNRGDSAAPDLAEIEISQIGKFFRPPLTQVGFAPLNDLLKESGYDQRIIPSRLAPWTKEGVIFGVPHDVHPVSLVFREDLFQEVGVDLASAKTWPEFQSLCLNFQERWRARDPQRYEHRHAMELHESNPDHLLMMLLQRHINLIDDNGRIHLADPKVAQTIAFYSQLVSGPKKIGADTSQSGWGIDLLAGNICALLSPDWRIAEIKKAVPELGGKLRMIPLPVFEPGDAPTSTWGGTMMGLLRTSKRKTEAWRLIQFLYFSPEGIVAERHESNILPAVKEYWDDPALHQPDPYFRNERSEPQRVGELYAWLAERIPPSYITPATSIAQMEVRFVLAAATQHLRQNGSAGLESACQRWLELAAQDLSSRIEHGKFEQ